MMSEPQRLHPAAILILAIRVSRQLVLPLLAPVVLNLLNRGISGLDFTFLILLFGALGLLVILSAGWGFLYWQRYTFQVVNNELKLKQGIIFRQERTIPRERIQAIDLVEGVLHRIFGLVAVRVQTAGGMGPGFSLVGISRTDADTLRHELSISAGQVREVESEAIDEEGEATESVGTGPQSHLIRGIAFSDLLLAAATSGGIGIALPIIGSVMSVINNATPQVDIFEVMTSFLGGVAWWSIAMVIIVAAWVLSFAGTIFAHAGFRLSRSGDNLLIERGLIEKRRATVPLNRIQAIQVVESIIRQPFGYTMVKVESAGYGEEAGESSVLFPMLPRSEVRGFLEESVPEFAWDPPELNRPPRRAARRYINRMVFLGLVVAAIPSLIFYPIGLWALLIVPVFALFGYLAYRDAGWAVEEGALVLRSRTLSRSTAIIPKRRIQSSDVKQNILQRRASLGNISATVASGVSGATFSLIHLDKGVADQLFAWTGRGQTRFTRSRVPRQLRPATGNSPSES